MNECPSSPAGAPLIGYPPLPAHRARERDCAMYEFDESRLEKIAGMREEGLEPYPHNLSVTHTAAEAVAMMGDRENEVLA